VNKYALARPIALRRKLPNRGKRVFDEVSLGIDGKCHLAHFAGVLPRRDLQRPLDALSLYCYLETRRTATHLDRDPYHLPTPSFRVKMAMFITYQLYFTILTVSSEIKLKSEEFRVCSRTVGLGVFGAMRSRPPIHPPSEGVGSPKLEAYGAVLRPGGGSLRRRTNPLPPAWSSRRRWARTLELT
jgi:hypothetical protein